MFKVLTVLLGFLSAAQAQTGTPVKQSGKVTPGHPVMWIADGVVGDGGTAVNGFLTSIGVLAQGPGICQQSGPLTGPYNQICLGVTTTGGGTISLNNYGGATGGLNFSVNGVPYLVTPFTVPIGGTGDTSFTANLPLIGNGTSPIGQGTRSGNTTKFATSNGTLVNGHCVSLDSSGNYVDAGGTCTTGGGGGTVTSGTAGQIAAYANNGATVVGQSSYNYAPGGFLNFLRNASLTSWQYGTTGTITTSGGWSADGVYVIPTGASMTFGQQDNIYYPPSTMGLQLNGASGLTDLSIRFPIESKTALAFKGETPRSPLTFQFGFYNNTGGTVTPTITTKYTTTSPDNWAGVTTDISATNLQPCTNGSLCTEAYTFANNGYSTNGYEVVVDFGAIGAGSNVVVYAFDLRSTPGISTGLNGSPPPAEAPNVAADIAWNMRFYQVMPSGATFQLAVDEPTNIYGTYYFPVPMRSVGATGAMPVGTITTLANAALSIAGTDYYANSYSISGFSSEATIEFLYSPGLTSGLGGSMINNSAGITFDSSIIGG